MNFIDIRNSSDPVATIIYKAYCETFPEAERRGEDQFKKLFEKKEVRILAINNEEMYVGYLIVWELKNCTFLEHFEVFEPYRNKSYGSKILLILKTLYSKIVLESEPSYLNETASRRIDFYERNDFRIILENYIQPSYGEGKPSLKLYLLANFEVRNPDQISKMIFNTVYS